MSYTERRALFETHMQRAHRHGPDDQGVIILNILEVVMSAIDTVQQEFDAYRQTVADTFAAQDTALAAALTKINDLAAQLQNAGVDPAQVQALTDDIASAQQVAQAELTKVQAAAGGTQPAGGGTVPAGGTVTPDPSAGTTPAGGGSAGPAAPAAAQTVYLTTEDPSTVDNAVWIPANVQTAPTDGTPPQRLYTYVDDVNPGDQNGAALAGWTVYDGPTQAVPAA